MTVNIQVENITFSYPAAPVLRNLTFHVKPGDFLGIVGPNGSGKSTLLKNLTTYLTPDQGAVYLDGQLLAEYQLSELARKQAVVPQENTVNFNFTVFELVSMGRAPYLGRFSRLSQADLETVRVAMEETNCWHLRQRKLFQLSGGERQRVILARTLAQTPEVLLLDEPTTFLDVGYQKEFMDLIARLNRERHLTVILVLHDLNLASEYCRELLLLEQGRIADYGSPEKVLTTETLQRVYNTHLTVIENPITGTPLVVLYPGAHPDKYRWSSSEDAQKTSEKALERSEYQASASWPGSVWQDSTRDMTLSGMKIHVIGGGGHATPLMQALFREGVNMRLGVVNLGDSDHKTAVEMGAEAVVCQPFSPIDEASHQRAKQYLETAEAVVMAPVPFGRGNLKNIALMEEAAKMGKPLVFFRLTPETMSDYTGGQARMQLEKVLRLAGDAQYLITDSVESMAEWLKTFRS